MRPRPAGSWPGAGGLPARAAAAAAAPGRASGAHGRSASAAGGGLEAAGVRRGARRGKSIYFLYTTGAGPVQHLYMEAAGRPDMARRLWIANLSAGEVRTDRAAILGELFELSGPARSKGRRDRNCAVRDMVTVLEQAVRHCIASVIDMGRARPPAELTLRSVDLPRAAGLSLGVAVSLAFTVSSTAGMRRQLKEFGLPDPFDGNPCLEERVQALLDARRARDRKRQGHGDSE